jgi:hypothetical protein
VPVGEDGTGHRRMLDQLKQNNRGWAEGKLAVDPVFFKRLEAQQRPEYLCVAAAVDGKRRGLSDHWLHPIREVTHDHQAELATYADEREQLNRLCELKSDEMSLAWSRLFFRGIGAYRTHPLFLMSERFTSPRTMKFVL